MYFRILSILLLCFSFLYGQTGLDYYLPATPSYDSAISTPGEAFGFDIGEWHLSPAQTLDYLRLLEKQSERIKIIPMGYSYENRPTVLMIITSTENHQNLDQIQSERAKLSNPSLSGDLDLDKMPGVIWLGYSIHGNEASGTNAVPLIAYYLAAANSADMDVLLENTVILIEPFINPDGLNRFATWVNMHKGKNLVSDSNSREHQEAWPFGRTNHYWFDLNRDWMPAQHPETQARLPHLYKWLPNIVTDHHEMGTDATFFFQPGVKSRNNPMVPVSTYDLTAKIARYHARALDDIGALYFTGELFDDFYIGKGSSLTDIIGTIGILFEQASARGHSQESDNGLLSFPFAIKNQVTASLSSLKAAQEMRQELNLHQKNFFKEAISLAEKNETTAFLLGSADRQRNLAMKELLSRHQIDMYDLKIDVKKNGYQYKSGRDFLIPLRQKQYRLIVSLFEERTIFQDSLFYDVSSWNLAHAFNLPLTKVSSTSELNRIQGAKVNAESVKAGEFYSEKPVYAYLMPWDSYNSARALHRLLSEDYICKVAEQAFDIQLNGARRSFREGTVLIPVSVQKKKRSEIENMMKRITDADGIDIFGVSTGYSDQGILLGSVYFSSLQKIRPLLIVGDGISAGEAGEVWHLLDQRLEMSCPIVDIGFFNTLDLSRYNVMTLVSGNYTSIDSAGIAHLKTWLDLGGTLISMRSANKWLSEKKLAKMAFKELTKVNKDTVTVRRKYRDARDFRGAQMISGAIFKTDLDLTHPLGFGFERNDVPLSKRAQFFIEPSANPYNTPLLFKQDALLSGYISQPNYDLLGGSAAIAIFGSGKGRIIAFAENPNFRAFWYGTNRLFINALMFGQIIRNYEY